MPLFNSTASQTYRGIRWREIRHSDGRLLVFVLACVRGCSLRGMVVRRHSCRIQSAHRRPQVGLQIIVANFQLPLRALKCEPIAIRKRVEP